MLQEIFVIEIRNTMKGLTPVQWAWLFEGIRDGSLDHVWMSSSGLKSGIPSRKTNKSVSTLQIHREMDAKGKASYVLQWITPDLAEPVFVSVPKKASREDAAVLAVLLLMVVYEVQFDLFIKEQTIRYRCLPIMKPERGLLASLISNPNLDENTDMVQNRMDRVVRQKAAALKKLEELDEALFPKTAEQIYTGNGREAEHVLNIAVRRMDRKTDEPKWRMQAKQVLQLEKEHWQRSAELHKNLAQNEVHTNAFFFLLTALLEKTVNGTEGAPNLVSLVISNPERAYCHIEQTLYGFKIQKQPVVFLVHARFLLLSSVLLDDWEWAIEFISSFAELYEENEILDEEQSHALMSALFSFLDTAILSSADGILSEKIASDLYWFFVRFIGQVPHSDESVIAYLALGALMQLSEARLGPYEDEYDDGNEDRRRFRALMDAMQLIEKDNWLLNAYPHIFAGGIAFLTDTVILPEEEIISRLIPAGEKILKAASNSSWMDAGMRQDQIKLITNFAGKMIMYIFQNLPYGLDDAKCFGRKAINWLIKKQETAPLFLKSEGDLVWCYADLLSVTGFTAAEWNKIIHSLESAADKYPSAFLEQAMQAEKKRLEILLNTDSWTKKKKDETVNLTGNLFWNLAVYAESADCMALSSRFPVLRAQIMVLEDANMDSAVLYLIERIGNRLSEQKPKAKKKKKGGLHYRSESDLMQTLYLRTALNMLSADLIELLCNLSDRRSDSSLWRCFAMVIELLGNQNRTDSFSLTTALSVFAYGTKNLTRSENLISLFLLVKQLEPRIRSDLLKMKNNPDFFEPSITEKMLYTMETICNEQATIALMFDWYEQAAQYARLYFDQVLVLNKSKPFISCDVWNDAAFFIPALVTDGQEEDAKKWIFLLAESYLAFSRQERKNLHQDTMAIMILEDCLAVEREQNEFKYSEKILKIMSNELLLDAEPALKQEISQRIQLNRLLFEKNSGRQQEEIEKTAEKILQPLLLMKPENQNNLTIYTGLLLLSADNQDKQHEDLKKKTYWKNLLSEWLSNNLHLHQTWQETYLYYLIKQLLSVFSREIASFFEKSQPLLSTLKVHELEQAKALLQAEPMVKRLIGSEDCSHLIYNARNADEIVNLLNKGSGIKSRKLAGTEILSDLALLFKQTWHETPQEILQRLRPAEKKLEDIPKNRMEMVHQSRHFVMLFREFSLFAQIEACQEMLECLKEMQKIDQLVSANLKGVQKGPALKNKKSSAGKKKEKNVWESINWDLFQAVLVLAEVYTAGKIIRHQSENAKNLISSAKQRFEQINHSPDSEYPVLLDGLLETIVREMKIDPEKNDHLFIIEILSWQHDIRNNFV